MTVPPGMHLSKRRIPKVIERLEVERTSRCRRLTDPVVERRPPSVHGDPRNRDHDQVRGDARRGTRMGGDRSGQFVDFPACWHRYPPVAALPTGVAQNAHLLAAIGIVLRHSGHSFAVGSGAASRRRIRIMSAFIGRITKKYTAAALESAARYKRRSNNRPKVDHKTSVPKDTEVYKVEMYARIRRGVQVDNS